MYKYFGVVNCAHFSHVIWLNVLITAIKFGLYTRAESAQLKSSCNNPFSDEVPMIYPLKKAANDDSPAEVFNATSLNEVAWSKLVYIDCKVHVKFECNASYPIEWVEHFDQDIEHLTDKTFKIKKNLWTDRLVDEQLLKTTNVSNLNSIAELTTYSAVLGVNYQERSLCAAANYTCQSVSNPCVQSNVISIVDRANKTIKYKRGSSVAEIEKNQENLQNATCDTTLELVTVKGYNNLIWRCKRKGRLFHKWHTGLCDAAMHCNSLFNHYKQGCVKVTEEKNFTKKHGCNGCMYKDKTLEKFYHPGYTVCEDEDGKILAVAHYFFSVIQSVDTREIPTIYLQWDDADPQKMLYLEPLPKEIFVGETIDIACKVSRYYFSYGHRFGFEYQNGTMEYTGCKENFAYICRVEDGKPDNHENVNRMTIPHNFTDPTLKRIYCFAPVWNSTIWINQSLQVHVRHDAAAPSMLDSTKSIDHVTFQLHQKNAVLSCKASGQPRPEINWNLDASMEKNQTNETEVNGTEGSRKDLIFQEVTEATSGRYICEAKNFLGTSKKMFIVTVKDPYADFVKLTIIMAVIFALTFIATLSLCWLKVRRQSKKIQALTEAEVAEFRNGNVDILENTEYLDTQELLQAVPYNESYEISCKCLYIDPTEILGSGNFGQVLKGVIYDRNDRTKNKVVAVKTSKPNSNFAFFKTLLTEVKIMSYIGHHTNIVSLVGACTENIRNRQIFIAVEFCAKGSLNSFLKSNRSSFVNLICEDTIYATTSLCDYDQNPTYENSSTSLEISTVHLLKWSREIANGMEFLGSKKIVHGDLASRNILLSNDLVAKIGDFGLSRVLMAYSNYVRSTQDDCHLPWAWLAPETLQELKFSVQSDVWSYGVTLWEIFSLAQQPYLGTVYNAAFLTFLNNGHRLHKPNFATSQIYNTIMECWHLEPSQRATFTDLKDLFEGLLVQSCNGDYVFTRSIGNGTIVPYVNRSHALVQNPGYTVLGRGDSSFFEDERDSDNDRTHVLTPSEQDTQGYLKPLVLA